MTPITTSTSVAKTTPTEPVRDHPILEYLPLYLGTSWTYSYFEQTEGDGGDEDSIKVQTGLVTETVVMVTTSFSDEVYTAKIAVAGRSYVSDCGEALTAEGDAEYWMVADASRLFIACSQHEASSLGAELVTGTDLEGATNVPSKPPELVLPLEEGKVWQAFRDVPLNEDDPAYEWYVESKLDVRMPAGSFTDCYSIRLLTHPDTTYRWVCPGTGIVAEEYHHHGTIHNYRVELVSYEVAAAH